MWGKVFSPSKTVLKLEYLTMKFHTLGFNELIQKGKTRTDVLKCLFKDGWVVYTAARAQSMINDFAIIILKMFRFYKIWFLLVGIFFFVRKGDVWSMNAIV